MDRRQVAGRRGAWATDHERGDAEPAVELHPDMLVCDGVGLEVPFERLQPHARGLARPIRARRERASALARRVGQPGTRHDLVDQAPRDRPGAAHALGDAAEEIGAVAADLALVDQPGQPAGAGQHREQCYLRQRHGGRAVIGHQDPVGRQRQLVAAARRDPGDHRQPDLPGVARGILDGVAGLVGEAAEIHLRAMARLRQHRNVGAGAEDALLGRGDDDGADRRVLEAQPLHGIVELDVDAEIVGIELQPIAGRQPLLLDVEEQGRDLAIDLELPVAPGGDPGLEVDATGACRRWGIEWRHCTPFVVAATASDRLP